VLCEWIVNGQYSNKLLNCLGCKFLQQVYQEEGATFILTPVSAHNLGPRLQDGCPCMKAPIGEHCR
jgi:hypothetical protein